MTEQNRGMLNKVQDLERLRDEPAYQLEWDDHAEDLDYGKYPPELNAIDTEIHEARMEQFRAEGRTLFEQDYRQHMQDVQPKEGYVGPFITAYEILFDPIDARSRYHAISRFSMLAIQAGYRHVLAPVVVPNVSVDGKAAIQFMLES